MFKEHVVAAPIVLRAGPPCWFPSPSVPQGLLLGDTPRRPSWGPGRLANREGGVLAGRVRKVLVSTACPSQSVKGAEAGKEECFQDARVVLVTLSLIFRKIVFQQPQIFTNQVKNYRVKAKSFMKF